MGIRERGIGNLAFIAVLLLMIIAGALAFVYRDEADNTAAKLAEEKAKASASIETLANANRAYDALYGTFGVELPAAKRTGDTYPGEAEIQNAVRTWLFEQATKIQAASQARLRNRQDQPQPPNEVRVVPGDMTTVELYGTPYVQTTIDVAKMLEPLEAQFRFAAKMVEDNNRLFEEEYEKYQTRIGELNTKITQVESKYTQDVSAKGQQADTVKAEADSMRDSVNELTAKIDTLQQKLASETSEFERNIRTANRNIQALQNRILAEKTQKEVALKEDPKDGEVLVADSRQGLVFINLGRTRKVGPGMRFTVWRSGKGNIREDIAVVRVIDSDATKSTCRILESLNPRVPPSAGMNVSNPFYDPHKTLNVYIYGDLRYFPSDLAKRRLAESGAKVMDTLDDTVNVIVLGDPPAPTGDEEAAEEEGEAALAERRANIAKEKAINEIIDKAISLGAVVVTEDVLRTFIQY